MRSAVALAVTLAVAAPAAAARPPLREADVQRVARDAAKATCQAVGWCTRYEVAGHCRRDGPNRRWCALTFVRAGGQRCKGVVEVVRGRTGRLDPLVAVPICESRRAPARGP